MIPTMMKVAITMAFVIYVTIYLYNVISLIITCTVHGIIIQPIASIVNFISAVDYKGSKLPEKEKGGTIHSQPIVRTDMQDESMRLNIELQWWEAFSYKVNVRVFREVDEATNEFDRFRQNGGNNNNNNDNSDNVNDNHPNQRL
jgi:hypothetical protein